MTSLEHGCSQNCLEHLSNAILVHSSLSCAQPKKVLLNQLTVVQKSVLLVLLPVVLELAFVFHLSSELTKAHARLKSIEIERDMVMRLQSIHHSIMRTFLIVCLPDQSDDALLLSTLKNEQQQIAITQDSLSKIQNVPASFDEACKQSAKMLTLVDKVFKDTAKVIGSPSIEKSERNLFVDPIMVLQLFSENRKLTKKVDILVVDFRKRGPANLAELNQSLLNSLAGGIGAGILVCILLWTLFSRDITGRIKRVSMQADNVLQGKPLTLPQEGRDEIAQLDRTLYEAAEELRQTRLREQAILDNANDVICSLDARYRFDGVSAVSEKCWKRNEADLLGAPLAMLLTKETLEHTLAELKRIANDGSGEFENQIELSPGKIGEFHWSVRWSRKEKRYFCTVHDVTELRAVERLKQKFIAIVSHDLRAPITSIGISLNMLREGKRGEVSEKVLSVLKRADSSLSTLTILVNELLDLEKLEAGKMTLNCSVVSAREICLSAAETLAGLAQAASIKMEVSETDCSLWADSLRLTQAVTNLMGNAIKFSPKKSTVRVEVQIFEDEVEIQVIDQGPGIPDQDKAAIFDKFRQSSVKSTLKEKSSGLGLSIVKAIVEAHNGSISVKDAAGEGSIFILRLPRLSGSVEKDEL